MTKVEFIIRLFIFYIGIFVLSLGVVLIIKADLGVSAWDVLHIGLYRTFGLTVGTWSQIVGLFIIFVTFTINRHIISIGTVLNMIFLGFFIDILLYFMPIMDNIVYQYIFLISGVVVMGIGAGLYITASLGPGPRDSLMIALTKKYGWSVKKVKTIMELLVLIVGWFLGGPVFIGTIIATFLIGPVIHYSLEQWEKILNPVFTYFKSISNNKKLNQIIKEEVL
ncbi:MAG: YitT family protein [Vulcanibacillus sp.]